MVGFRSTADVMGVFALICGIINFILVFVVDWCCPMEKFTEEKELEPSYMSER